MKISDAFSLALRIVLLQTCLIAVIQIATLLKMKKKIAVKINNMYDWVK
jgi:hypothetical protein